MGGAFRLFSLPCRRGRRECLDLLLRDEPLEELDEEQDVESSESDESPESPGGP